MSYNALKIVHKHKYILDEEGEMGKLLRPYNVLVDFCPVDPYVLVQMGIPRDDGCIHVGNGNGHSFAVSSLNTGKSDAVHSLGMVDIPSLNGSPPSVVFLEKNSLEGLGFLVMLEVIVPNDDFVPPRFYGDCEILGKADFLSQGLRRLSYLLVLLGSQSLELLIGKHTISLFKE